MSAPFQYQTRRFSRILMLISLVLAALDGQAGAQDAGKASTLPNLAVDVAFPNLSFTRPVVFTCPKDKSNLLFVVEQPGVIQSFPNDPGATDKQVFLDIRKEVNSSGNEEGLLGLAFHPKYAENGVFYVYYSTFDSANRRRSVVSRFNVSKTDPRKADAASEVRVWTSQVDPFENHNGGCIEFGPDGFLYISLGDSGAADDPLLSGQNPKDWFGSILRIDVDHESTGKKYAIPADNPSRQGLKFRNWAPEVYCIGLRNVWKFTFDRETGTCWAGDVGQNIWEEVVIVKNGGNYGWSLEEGFHPFRTERKKDTASPILKPVVEYKHDVGQSITGGYVYRGKKIPGLVGAYVYGDFQSGRIWAVREKDGAAVENREVVDLTKYKPIQISAFGEDPDGELFILGLADGKVHKISAAK